MYIACDLTSTRAAEVRQCGHQHPDADAAQSCAKQEGYQAVRFVGPGGFLYVDVPIGTRMVQQYYQATNDWVAMIAEVLRMLHTGDLRYAGRHPEDWTSHAAELVGRYRRREDWHMLV